MTVRSDRRADDHPLVRQGLQAALAPYRGRGRGRGDHRLSRDPRGRALRPDVVVMDLQMPDLNGVDAARELARAVPTTAS
jgi:DNA-binding NarL/FixJ family response regulator